MSPNAIAPGKGVCYADLSITFCCLNERSNLPTVLQRLKALESDLGERLREVIVVDGGSSDGSWELLKQAAAEWNKLKPLRQQPPQGYGSGYRQSVLACSGDLIATCDADLNYDVTEITRMLPLLSEADLVVANPFLKGARAWLGPSRRVLTHGVSFLYRCALVGRKRGTVFTPILRIGKAALFQKTAPQCRDFTASAEFITRVYLTTDARVVEIPISVHARGAGVSKLRKFRTILAHLCLLRRVISFRMGFRKEL